MNGKIILGLVLLVALAQATASESRRQLQVGFCSYPMWMIPGVGTDTRCDYDSGCDRRVTETCNNIYGITQGQTCMVYCDWNKPPTGPTGYETWECTGNNEWTRISQALSCGCDMKELNRTDFPRYGASLTMTNTDVKTCEDSCLTETRLECFGSAFSNDTSGTCMHFNIPMDFSSTVQWNDISIISNKTCPSNPPFVICDNGYCDCESDCWLEECSCREAVSCCADETFTEYKDWSLVAHNVNCGGINDPQTVSASTVSSDSVQDCLDLCDKFASDDAVYVGFWIDAYMDENCFCYTKCDLNEPLKYPDEDNLVWEKTSSSGSRGNNWPPKKRN